jgi:hypothetical protein
MITIAVGASALAASAEELPPLRENKQKLDALFSNLQISHVRPNFPTAPSDISFKAISIDVGGLAELAQFGLIDQSADSPALSNFVRSAVEARLQELGISEQIKIQMRPEPPRQRTADCDVLRVMFFFRASEIEFDGQKVVAVVINLLSWQGAVMPQSNGTSECLGDRAPPWTGIDGTHAFLPRFHDRDDALAKSKQALLSLIDGPILFRIVATNATARRSVMSWLKGSN